MERPALPPVPPGRSALPSFLAVEAGLREQGEAETLKAKAVVAEAEAEAGRLREEGEQRLKQLVLEAEEQAKREAEARARDRISDVRVKTQHWIEAAERASQDAVEDAVRRLVEGGDASS